MEIDWSAFDHASDALLDEIPVAPQLGSPKIPVDTKGTRITIKGLGRDWSRSHVDDIARTDFARLNDPFSNSSRFPIIVTHNNDPVAIPKLDKWVLNHAHGECEGSFRSVDGTLVFSGRMASGGKIENFNYDATRLLSASKASSLEVLSALGPFTVRFYWYNRRKLTALDGIGDLATVRARLALWTGGLMVYRDGFRVPPYGGPDDDWLDLDRVALSRGGYKLNRAQIVGRVAITHDCNPRLNDQANREGLIDNEELRALKALLTHLIQQTFWSFLGRVEASSRPVNEPVSDVVIGRRLANEEERLSQNLAVLIQRVPEVRNEGETLDQIKVGVGNIISLMDEVHTLATSYENGRTQLLNLASVGLTVEILAHELNRAAETALDTLDHLPQGELSSGSSASLRSLGAQLKTLQKRLKVLDPLSTAGRNRKEKIEVGHLVNDVMASHAGQFEREGIALSFKIEPPASRAVLTLVRGMIVQVLENMISNSVYWLRQQKRLDPGFKPMITVRVLTDTQEITFSDNGPGISPEDRDSVFDAFFTNRPAGDGKGLGLFISREIAKYHKAELTLEQGDDGVLRTFVLDLGAVQ